jgi:hypothetical protein
MTEAQIFNLFMFLFGIGIVGWIVTYKAKGGGELDSDAIVRHVVLKNRKSRKVQIWDAHVLVPTPMSVGLIGIISECVTLN